jgi:hypothetical protein
MNNSASKDVDGGAGRLSCGNSRRNKIGPSKFDALKAPPG